MSFNNRNNLPNPSAPWGREVEQRVESAERAISSNVREASNALSTTGNTLNNVAAQQAALISLNASRVSVEVVPFSYYISADGASISSNTVPQMRTITPPSWANRFSVTTTVSTQWNGTATGIWGETWVDMEVGELAIPDVNVSAKSVAIPGMSGFYTDSSQTSSLVIEKPAVGWSEYTIVSNAYHTAFSGFVTFNSRTSCQFIWLS